MVVSRDSVQDDMQAQGILRFMLDKGRASRKQVAWLIGYVKRLREIESGPRIQYTSRIPEARPQYGVQGSLLVLRIFYTITRRLSRFRASKV